MTLTDASGLLAQRAVLGWENAEQEKEAVAILLEEAAKVAPLEEELARLRKIVEDCGWQPEMRKR